MSGLSGGLNGGLKGGLICSLNGSLNGGLNGGNFDQPLLRVSAGFSQSSSVRTKSPLIPSSLFRVIRTYPFTSPNLPMVFRDCAFEHSFSENSKILFGFVP